jgi:hypothetical protein
MAHSDKKAKRAVNIKGIKSAAELKQSGGYFGHPPIFSFTKYDAKTPWSTTVSRKPTVDDIFFNIRGIGGLTWSEIIQASGGRSHGTNSHYIRIEELSADARRRANEIDLNEDGLFSLRLQGDVRLWGVIEPDGCFFVIWYDPEHKIYSVQK